MARAHLNFLSRLIGVSSVFLTTWTRLDLRLRGKQLLVVFPQHLQILCKHCDLGLAVAAMDGIQLRDEAVRDRVRAAEEFLDPSMPLHL